MSKDASSYFKRRAKRSTFTSVFSVTLVLLLLGLFGVVMIHSRSTVVLLKENFMVDVFFKDSATVEQVNAFTAKLNNAPYTKRSIFVSKEEAAKRLKGTDMEDFIAVLGENPLRRSVDLYVKSTFADSLHLAEIRRELQSDSCIEEVSYKLPAIDQFNSNLSKIGIVGFSLLIILFVVSVSLINNSIKLALFSKAFVIKSMQLVGATNSFIRKPYLIRGVIQGAFSGVIACVALWVLMESAILKYPELNELRDPAGTWLVFGCILIFGIAMTVISTLLSVNRYLSLKVDELYG